ncbi:hypothetical protein D3C71_876900 [compost metagenome]
MHDGRQLRRFIAKAQPFKRALRPEHLHDLLQKLRQAQFAVLQPQPARLDARDVQQTIDQADQMLATAMNHINGLTPRRWQAWVALQNLRVTQNAVQGRAQLMAHAAHEAALGQIGAFGRFLGLLQLRVGLLVRLDFAQQQMGLSIRFLLRHAPAFMGQHQPPGHDAADQQQGGIQLQEAWPQTRGVQAGPHMTGVLLVVDQAQNAGQQRPHPRHDQEVVAQAAMQQRCDPRRQQPTQNRLHLILQAPLRFAAILATGIQRAAQGTDGTVIGRAMRHVRLFETVGADHTDMIRTRDIDRRARQVVAPARAPGDDRRADKSRQQGHKGRQGLRQRARRARKHAGKGQQAQRHGDQHAAHTDRVDVIQIGAAKLDSLRRQTQRLVDHQIRHQRSYPGQRNVREHRQHMLQRAKHAHLHQDHGDQHVEHQPHHPARMAVRDAGKEVGPGQRAGIRIGHIDLDLRDHHEGRDQSQRQAGSADHIGIGRQIHMGGVARFVGRGSQGQGQPGQKGAAQNLGRARQDPARTRADQGKPPASAVGGGAFGQKAQKVDLFADLRHQRGGHRHRRAEHQQVEIAAPAVIARKPQKLLQGPGITEGDEGIGQEQQHQPYRLRPCLQPADEGNAIRHHGQDHRGAQEIADGQRQAGGQLDGQRHDGRLQRKKNKGKGGVDQRGNGRADVAKAGPARQQIHVQAMARRVIGNRQAGQEGDQGHGDDGPEGVDEAIVQRQRTADGFQRQERHRAQGGIGDAELRPLAKRHRRETQRIVFQRLIGDPGVVVAANLDDALRRAGRQIGLRGSRGYVIERRCRCNARGVGLPVRQSTYVALRHRLLVCPHPPGRGMCRACSVSLVVIH